MFQRDGAFGLFNHRNIAISYRANPISKFREIWNSRAETEHLNFRWRKDDTLFPHRTALNVIDVMHLIENDVIHLQ